jgi:ABC-type transport system involved in multi-copper enzyme maturation permease subunit
MFDLMRGELYRLAHKKSLFIYFAALTVAYLLLAFIRSGGFTATSAGDDAMSLFGFLPPFIGVILFAGVYTDDLDSRNLIALVGFGLGKVRIVVAKLVVFALLAGVIFALVP